MSMRTMVIMAALLVSTAALAQSNEPAAQGTAPMVGDRPLVQIKPKGAKAAKPQPAPPASDAAGETAADSQAEPAPEKPSNAAKSDAKAGAKSGTKSGAKAAAKPSVAQQLQACLEIEDATKERLDCYDAIYAPKPAKPGAKPKPANTVADCRVVKEEDERLACYNRFADKIPKLPKT
jgi:hypothetical protein